MVTRLLMKWLTEGDLTPEEEASLPAGLLDRFRRHIERKLIEGLESGDAGELTRERLEAIRERAWAKVSDTEENPR